MKRCLIIVLCLLLALSVLPCAHADKLDDVNLCVGGEAAEWYYSRGAYIGKVAVADPSVVSAAISGTMLSISGYISYGTEISFTGLKPGRTTVSMYSEYGGRMGSVTVVVKEHDYKKAPAVLKAMADGGETFYRADKTSVCSLCGASVTETVCSDGKTHEAATPVEMKVHKYMNSYDDMEELRSRLADVGYYLGSDTVKTGNKYDLDTANAIRRLRAMLGGDNSSNIEPELLCILKSGFAPAYRDGYTAPAYTVLEEGDEGENVTALQKKLVSFGYLPEENVSGVYDAYTVFAVQLIEIDMGYTEITGEASAFLQAALLLADENGHKLTKEDYAARYETLAACIGEPAADVYVLVTTGCNARSNASYEGATLLWANEGEEYLYIDEVNGWYKVLLPDGREAFLPMERAKIMK